MHLFCFGLGYSAQRLARRLQREGWRVGGTVRASEKIDALRAEGLEAVRFDERAAVTTALKSATHVLISAPPDASGDPVLALYGEALAPFAARWHWLSYLSTTGVYGDRDGAWVDENTPLAPKSERARRRVDAEDSWCTFSDHTGTPLHLFRLPGIYGPGRSAIDSLRAGTARRIDKPGQMFSRIHVDDIAGALYATIRLRHPGIYNLCDDEPAPQHEVVAYAADLLGIAPPPLEPFDQAIATMSPMAQSFYSESKRVSNALIKRTFRWTPLYPSYREGLKAIQAQT